MSEQGKLSYASPRVLFRAGVIFFCLFTVFTWQLPFYGDHVSIISTPANYYYETNFSSLIPPVEISTGHPPFYVLLHAFSWKLFGHHLVVSHLITLCFAIFLFYQFYQLCRKWLNERAQFIALCLFLLQPVIITQVSMMSTDILLCGLFLLGLNAILSNKRKLLFIAVAFSLLISARGIISAGLLFIAEFILTGASIKNFFRYSFQYLLAAIPVLLWYGYHYAETGWIFSSPESPWAKGREWVTLRVLPLKVFEYLLRYAEFGMIIPWIVIMLFSKRIIAGERAKKYFIYLVIAVVFFSCFIIFFKNPVMTRYILPVQLIALMVFAYVAAEYIKSQWQRVVVLFAALLFIAHHFFVYPQMRSSVFEYSWGEGSLAHLSYFQFREEALKYVRENNIDPAEIYTGFPDYKNFHDTDLDENRVGYNTLDEQSLSQCKYIIYSNVMNGISKTAETALKQNWVRLKTWYAYPVEYIIFKNPAETPVGNS